MPAFPLGHEIDGHRRSVNLSDGDDALARTRADYVPELLDADAPTPADILTGIKLQAVADAHYEGMSPKEMCYQISV
jgi:hypothetical protein